MTQPDDAATPQSARGPSLVFDWRINLALFFLTIAAVLWTKGWQFTIALLMILLAHEFGHYFAARVHGVPASLPFFLPMPVISPFGTMGAVILMPDRIRSRKALLDIGAAGPLAGMIVAIPVIVYGLARSNLTPVAPPSSGVLQEGQSILYWAMKRVVFGPIPTGYDVDLHPVAFAGWAGFFVTFLNLLPFGQLDGGHIAFALFGERQNRFARLMRFVPLVLAGYNYARPLLHGGITGGIHALAARYFVPDSPSVAWLILFLLLSAMMRFAGRDHPPVDDHDFGPVRRAIAVASLILFVLLFLPTPLELL